MQRIPPRVVWGIITRFLDVAAPVFVAVFFFEPLESAREDRMYQVHRAWVETTTRALPPPHPHVFHDENHEVQKKKVFSTHTSTKYSRYKLAMYVPTTHL